MKIERSRAKRKYNYFTIIFGHHVYLKASTHTSRSNIYRTIVLLICNLARWQIGRVFVNDAGGPGFDPRSSHESFFTLFARISASTSVFGDPRGSEMFSSCGKSAGDSGKYKIISVGPSVQKLRVKTCSTSISC